MTAFETVDKAKEFWYVGRCCYARCKLSSRIKGKKFTIATLLTGGDESIDTFKDIINSETCAVTVARLAPQDYHRFHSPVEGVCGEIKDIKGELYSEAMDSRCLKNADK